MRRVHRSMFFGIMTVGGLNLCEKIMGIVSVRISSICGNPRLLPT
jgi:hypothetical protein